MAISTIDGVTGDWGDPAPDYSPVDWTDASATVQPNGPQVQANSVLTQSTVAVGQDKWTGFFQNLVGTAAQYAIQKDAAKTGLVPATAANGQPTYVQNPTALRVGNVAVGGWIVIGAAVVGALLLARKG